MEIVYRNAFASTSKHVFRCVLFMKETKRPYYAFMLILCMDFDQNGRRIYEWEFIFTFNASN